MFNKIFHFKNYITLEIPLKSKLNLSSTIPFSSIEFTSFFIMCVKKKPPPPAPTNFPPEAPFFNPII